MNLPHDLIEYIYTFIHPKPCRNSFMILDSEFYRRYLNRTISCNFMYFYGLEWCERHHFVRPKQVNRGYGPGCITS